jgi:hypothetical protein
VPHAVATRKAHFLASFQATLIRSSYAMLTLHTATPATAQPPASPAPSIPVGPATAQPPASPAPSIPTSDDDDQDTPRRTTTTTPGRT